MYGRATCTHHLKTRPAPPPTTKNKYVHFSVMFNPRRYTFTWAGEIFIRNEDLTQETTSAEIADKGNKELIESLTTADGMLGAGLQPAVRTANEEGTKVLLETILHDSKVEKAKKKTKKDTGKDRKGRAPNARRAPWPFYVRSTEPYPTSTTNK